jgi:hypothetical protein
MTFLRNLGSRLGGHDDSANSSASATGPAGSQADAAMPFPGYDRLDERRVVDGLAGHSQVELEAVERYERAHKDREPVLAKLRYMRQPEPLPGYDALTVEEIVAALDQADMATVKKVRGYERKFANRPSVLDEVTRVRHRGQAAEARA